MRRKKTYVFCSYSQCKTDDSCAHVRIIAGCDISTHISDVGSTLSFGLSSVSKARHFGERTKRSTPCVRLSAASGDSFGSILSWGTDQWSAQLDKLMREVDLQYGTVVGQAAAGGFVMQFPVDLRESTDAYQCALDVPGMAKADIKVCF